jgi:hypothetical protein
VAASSFAGRRGLRPGLCLVAVATVAVAGGQTRDRAPDPISTNSSIAAAPSSRGTSKQPTVPKVPFNNQPCQSLTATDQQALKMAGVQAKPDRAPATPLPATAGDGVFHYSAAGYLPDRMAWKRGWLRSESRSESCSSHSQCPNPFWIARSRQGNASSGWPALA